MNISIKYFTAPWCGPCRMFGPVVEKVTGELGVPLHKINVDDNRDLATQYNISSEYISNIKEIMVVTK